MNQSEEVAGDGHRDLQRDLPDVVEGGVHGPLRQALGIHLALALGFTAVEQITPRGLAVGQVPPVGAPAAAFCLNTVLCLNAKARIWSCLSYMCHVRLTAVGFTV